MEKKKNIPLRVAWIAPFIFLVLLDIALIIFVSMNFDGLKQLPLFLGWWIPPYEGALPPFSEAHMYLIFIVLFTGVLIINGFKIASWIREGKL